MHPRCSRWCVYGSPAAVSRGGLRFRTSAFWRAVRAVFHVERQFCTVGFEAGKQCGPRLFGLRPPCPFPSLNLCDLARTARRFACRVEPLFRTVLPGGGRSGKTVHAPPFQARTPVPVSEQVRFGAQCAPFRGGVGRGSRCRGGAFVSEHVRFGAQCAQFFTSSANFVPLGSKRENNVDPAFLGSGPRARFQA